MDKILSIWKPKNITSFDVIKEVKKYIHHDKIGHCGTLDPFAEGILILCIGAYTKKTKEFMDYKKKYKATIKLGEETNTLDLTGDIIRKTDKISKLSKNKILKILNLFVGEIKQIPPYYSAKKINGIKLYSLARKDIFIRRRPTKVTIYNISLDYFDVDTIKITIECGKGTYIRSLGRDIAYALNTFGYIEELKRIQVGEYRKDNSINYTDIKNVITS